MLFQAGFLLLLGNKSRTAIYVLHTQYQTSWIDADVLVSIQLADEPLVLSIVLMG